MPAAIVRSAATLGLERAMLVSFALVCSLVACQDPEQPTGPALSQGALPKSITLTYICGNSFRVRNTNPTAITVTWDVYKTAETDTLILPPKPTAASYSETYFTTVHTGTVRLFLDGVLIQTKANGNKPVCALPADTTRPAIPSMRNLDTVIDTSIVASPPGDDVTIAYRNVFAVKFDDSTSGTTIRQFLSELQGEIIAGAPDAGEYVIRFPDPGPSYASVDSLQRVLLARSGVRYAVTVKHRSGAAVYSRYPVDGLGARRGDWIGTSTDFTRPRLQVRAPLAWGCETGNYGGARPSIGVVDFFFNRTLPDISPLLTPVSAPDSNSYSMELSHVNQDHGTSVATILAGVGNDSAGISGMIWNADLSLFSLTANGNQPRDLVGYFVTKVVPEASRRGVRILVMSMSIGRSDSAEVLRLHDAIVRYVSGGGLLVNSVGNFSGFRDVQQLLHPVTPSPNLGLEIAAAKLILDGAPSKSGLLLVAGTDNEGKFWEGGSFYPGVTEILAPATNVATLDRNGNLFTVDSGNSLAAPFVGGVAAELLAMDPSLTAAEVKDLIIRGSAVPRVDPRTGETVPAPDPGAPGSNVHQLDAYGSLSLLSAGDEAAPICGFPVTTAFVTDPQTGQTETSVRIARPGFAPQEVFVGNVENVTVAQGGRRIGVDAYAGSHNINFQNGSWNVSGALTFRGYRQFLETDTAFTDYATGPAVLTMRGAGTTRGPFDLCAGVTSSLPAFGTSCSLGPIASTGAWAHVVVDRSNFDITGCGADQGFYGSYLVPIGQSAGPQVLRAVSFDPCPPASGAWSPPGVDVLAWRADGAVAWLGQSDNEFFVTPGVPDSLHPHPGTVITPTAVQTRFRQVAVESGLAVLGARTLSDRLAYALGWRADGSTLVSYEYVGLEGVTCKREVRAGLAPELAIADSSRTLAPCGSPVLEPLAANLRMQPGPGQVASAVQARLRALRARSVQRAVMVN